MANVLPPQFHAIVCIFLLLPNMHLGLVEPQQAPNTLSVNKEWWRRAGDGWAGDEGNITQCMQLCHLSWSLL